MKCWLAADLWRICKFVSFCKVLNNTTVTWKLYLAFDFMMITIEPLRVHILHFVWGYKHNYKYCAKISNMLTVINKEMGWNFVVIFDKFKVQVEITQKLITKFCRLFINLQFLLTSLQVFVGMQVSWALLSACFLINFS